MKFLLRTLETRISFTHVHDHMIKHLKWDNMIREQQLNVTMDTKIRKALGKAIENVDYITPSFPHERLVMEYGERRVTASATEAIYKWKSRKTAKALYHGKGIVDEDFFDLIYTGKGSNIA